MHVLHLHASPLPTTDRQNAVQATKRVALRHTGNIDTTGLARCRSMSATSRTFHSMHGHSMHYERRPASRGGGLSVKYSMRGMSALVRRLREARGASSKVTNLARLESIAASSVRRRSAAHGLRLPTHPAWGLSAATRRARGQAIMMDRYAKAHAQVTSMDYDAIVSPRCTG